MLPTLAILILSLTGSIWSQESSCRADEAWGPRYGTATQTRALSRRSRPRGEDTMVRLRHWNEIAIDASGLDHTPVAPGESRVFGEQLGPGRSSKAMAVVHIAVFDAINAIAGGLRSYTGLERARERTSMDAAIAQAAHDTLAASFPSQRASFDELLAEDLDQIRDGRAKENGIELGRQAAAAILALRAGDGSQHAELAARRAGQQPDRAELHAALPGLSFRTRRVRRRSLPDSAQVLWDRPHRLHFRVGRVQRRDARQRWKRAPTRPAQFLVALPGRGGKRPEPHLPRHSLVVRQDRGHRARAARG